MTIDQAAAEITKWLKRIIGVALLAVVAVTAIELLGFNVPGIDGVPLTQNAGIGAAGLGFLYSKL